MHWKVKKKNLPLFYSLYRSGLEPNHRISEACLVGTSKVICLIVPTFPHQNVTLPDIIYSLLETFSSSPPFAYKSASFYIAPWSSFLSARWDTA